MRTASLACIFPSTNKCFTKPPTPHPNSIVSLTGTIYSEAILEKSGVRRLPFEISEIAFLGQDKTPTTTPVKGSLSYSSPPRQTNAHL